MSAKIIDGKAISSEIKSKIKKEIEELKSRGIVPGLATLLVGDNPASQIYVRNKHRGCEEAGIASFNVVLPKESTQKDVLKKIGELNQDPKIHAILVQLPLPPQINPQEVLLAINPEKDADGFHPQNLGKLFAAKSMKELNSYGKVVPLPCTPHGIMVMLEKIGVPISGKTALVVGRSNIVGKPMAILLMAHHATVIVAHSQTRNLIEYCQQADILVAATGQAQMIKGEMIKKDSVVIDVGMNRTPDGKLCGDVDFDAAKEKAGWITPVPGGVGPMTIVMLLQNTIQLTQNVHDR